MKKYIAFAYDNEHGDKGEKIETLKKWLSKEL